MAGAIMYRILPPCNRIGLTWPGLTGSWHEVTRQSEAGRVRLSTKSYRRGHTNYTTYEQPRRAQRLCERSIDKARSVGYSFMQQATSAKSVAGVQHAPDQAWQQPQPVAVKTHLDNAEP